MIVPLEMREPLVFSTLATPLCLPWHSAASRT